MTHQTNFSTIESVLVLGKGQTIQKSPWNKYKYSLIIMLTTLLLLQNRKIFMYSLISCKWGSFPSTILTNVVIPLYPRTMGVTK